MANTAKEWFEVDGFSQEEFLNLEEATAFARERVKHSDSSYDIYRVTRTPVRCVYREVSVKETDLPEPAKP